MEASGQEQDKAAELGATWQGSGRDDLMTTGRLVTRRHEEGVQLQGWSNGPVRVATPCKGRHGAEGKQQRRRPVVAAHALYQLAEAMGKDGEDRISAFAPLLDGFLADGGDVDAHLPKIGMPKTFGGKTLATIACNWDINAPLCLQLLVDRGADVLARWDEARPSSDDEQRGLNPARYTPVYAATITATVAGTDLDRRCLDIIAAVPGAMEHVHEARVKRLIYDVMRYLRLGSTAHERRGMYRQIFTSGFESSWGCPYSARDINEALAPMRVVSLTDFRSHGAIPRSSEGIDCGTEDMDADAPCVFFSHRWLSPHVDPMLAHPDNAAKQKHKNMLGVMETAAADSAARQQPVASYNPVRTSGLQRQGSAAAQWRRRAQVRPMFSLRMHRCPGLLLAY